MRAPRGGVLGKPSPPLKTISGLGGAIPTVWDSGWQLYTDLTKEQIAAYQAMLEWQTFVADHSDWEQSKVGSAPSLTVSAIQTNTALRAPAIPNKTK